MRMTYTLPSSLCLLLLASGAVVSCSAEQPAQTEQTDVKKIEQQAPVPSNNRVVANEEDVMTWEESADKEESSAKKAELDK